MIHKIEPTLLNSVKALSFNEMKECVCYANHYHNLKLYLDANFKNVYSIPFINAFVVKLNYEDLFLLSNLNKFA